MKSNASLLDKTRELLKQRRENQRLTLPMIAKGAGVSEPWLKAFLSDSIDDPGVRKVQALHDFLAHDVPEWLQ